MSLRHNKFRSGTFKLEPVSSEVRVNQDRMNQDRMNQDRGTHGRVKCGRVNHPKTWCWFAPLGSGVIGLGATLSGHSVGLKSSAASFWTWFLRGTLSLVVLNRGVALFGEAVKHRTLFELKTPERDT